MNEQISTVDVLTNSSLTKGVPVTSWCQPCARNTENVHDCWLSSGFSAQHKFVIRKWKLKMVRHLVRLSTCLSDPVKRYVGRGRCPNIEWICRNPLVYKYQFLRSYFFMHASVILHGINTQRNARSALTAVESQLTARGQLNGGVPPLTPVVRQSPSYFGDIGAIAVQI